MGPDLPTAEPSGHSFASIVQATPPGPDGGIAAGLLLNQKNNKNKIIRAITITIGWFVFSIYSFYTPYVGALKKEGTKKDY